MLRARIAVAVAALCLLGAAPVHPPEPPVAVRVRPPAPSARPHRIYHAGPARCLAPPSGYAVPWLGPVWVDVDLPPVRRPRAPRRPPGRR